MSQEQLNKRVAKFEANFTELCEALTFIEGLIALTNGGLKEEGKAIPRYPSKAFSSSKEAINSFMRQLKTYSGKRLIWRDRPILDSFESCKICNAFHADGIDSFTKEPITEHEWQPETIYTVYSRFKVEG